MTHWTHVLQEHWGITAELKRLDGEYDLNFLAEGPEGSGYVLKAMRPGCEEWLVDLQIKALDHIAVQEPGLPVPEVIAARTGEKLLRLADENGAERLVWLIARLPGRCYALAAPKTEALIAEVGAVLGRSTRALADFDHPQLTRDFKWDLMRAEWIAADLGCITDPRVTLCSPGFARRFKR